MSILYPVLRLFASEKRLHELIFWAIETEVASVNNVATLFRSDDYASRLVLTYSKAVGFKFVQNVLREPIRKVCLVKAVDVELHPSKIEVHFYQSALVFNLTILHQGCRADTRECRTCDGSLSRDTEFYNGQFGSGQIMTDIECTSNASFLQLPATFYHICNQLNTHVFHRFDYPIEHSNREEGRENLTRVCGERGRRKNTYTYTYCVECSGRILIPPTYLSGNHNTSLVRTHTRSPGRRHEESTRSCYQIIIQSSNLCQV